MFGKRKQTHFGDKLDRNVGLKRVAVQFGVLVDLIIFGFGVNVGLLENPILVPFVSFGPI